MLQPVNTRPSLQSSAEPTLNFEYLARACSRACARACSDAVFALAVDFAGAVDCLAIRALLLGLLVEVGIQPMMAAIPTALNTVTAMPAIQNSV